MLFISSIEMIDALAEANITYSSGNLPKWPKAQNSYHIRYLKFESGLSNLLWHEY